MELTEMEKRMLYQTESCERYTVINELSMASQYAGDPARRKAAKDLMEKLCPLSDAGCMFLFRQRMPLNIIYCKTSCFRYVVTI